MLAFLLKRLEAGLPKSQYQIVLATSDQKPDAIIAAWGRTLAIPVIRGDEQDVLKRFAKCLRYHPSETVVRVTGDNPLTSPEIIQWMVLTQKKKQLDYVDCGNCPCGAGSDLYRSKVLLSLNREITNLDEREHINLSILRNPELFKIYHLHLNGLLNRPELRMTVDTLEDWLRVNNIFDTCESEPWTISLSQAIERMDHASV
jgi:spore coat polysaccharide biosynthesis protein SpsF